MADVDEVERSELETVKMALEGAQERAERAERKVAELEAVVTGLRAAIAIANEDANVQRVKQLKKQMYGVYEALEEASRHPECKLAKDAVAYLNLK
jgi:multidrug resistance efflux pump